MIVIHKIKIDMQASAVPEVVNVVQLDSNTRVIQAALYSGNVPFEIGTNASVSLACFKPDRTKCWYDELPNGNPAASVEGNTVSITLAPEVLTVAGSVNAAIVIREGLTDQISTFPFWICVARNPAAGSIISNNYYKVSDLESLNNWMKDVLCCTPQEWTDEQQAQARQNIGAMAAGIQKSLAINSTEDTAADVVLESELRESGTAAIQFYSGGADVGAEHRTILGGLADGENDTDAATVGQVKEMVSQSGGGTVKTVNGIAPDKNGNVEIETGGGSADGAVLYTEQELNDAQQSQARANIGAADVSDIIYEVKSESINLFNPNTVTQKTVANIDYYISEVIPCSVGDVVYVKTINESNKITSIQYGLWLIATNGSEVFVSGGRMLEYTVENHTAIPELLGVKIGFRVDSVPIENLSKMMVTINTNPTVFEPWGEEIVRERTNLVEKSIKCIPQTLTEEEKSQARANIGAVGENTGSAEKTFKKVLVIGDSISTDYYGNYPKWVTVLKNEGFFPANTTNDSIHATGFVARYNNEPNDFISRITAIADKNTYDLVVIFGGINDFIGSTPLGGIEGETDITTYFKPAVDYFFDYLVNNFTQARIVVLSPLRTYRIYPNTAGFKASEYTSYICDVAKFYCLPVLNLTEESGFCPFNEKFSNMWTFTGWTGGDGTKGDGVHPSEEYEAKFLAPMIKNFLKRFI